jgi:signal transduction histidine kinase
MRETATGRQDKVHHAVICVLKRNLAFPAAALRLFKAPTMTHAEAASRAKSAFLANTSHEIRTPLNGLLGLARLALDAKVSDTQRVDYLKGIMSSAEQLAGLISDILDLSKIEAGKMESHPEFFNLDELIHHTCESLQPLANIKSLNFVFENQIGTCAIYHDSIRIKQVITNLVSNAIKFTDHGEVCVELKYASDSVNGSNAKLANPETNDDSRNLVNETVPTSPFATSNILISVRDTGIGIEPEFQRTIFEQFRQVDQSSTRKHGGTGLGLAITEQLVLLMGGTIYVESVVNQGSTFTIELPPRLRD